MFLILHGKMSNELRNIRQNKKRDYISFHNKVTAIFFLILFLFGQNASAFTYFVSNIHISKQQTIDKFDYFSSVDVFKHKDNSRVPLDSEPNEPEQPTENDPKENLSKDSDNLEGLPLVSERIKLSKNKAITLTFISEFNRKSKTIPLFVLQHSWKSFLS